MGKGKIISPEELEDQVLTEKIYRSIAKEQLKEQQLLEPQAEPKPEDQQQQHHHHHHHHHHNQQEGKKDKSTKRLSGKEVKEAESEKEAGNEKSSKTTKRLSKGPESEDKNDEKKTKVSKRTSLTAEQLEQKDGGNQNPEKKGKSQDDQMENFGLDVNVDSKEKTLRKKDKLAKKIYRKVKEFRIVAEIRNKDLQMERVKLESMMIRIEAKRREFERLRFVSTLDNYVELLLDNEIKKKWEIMLENHQVKEPWEEIKQKLFSGDTLPLDTDSEEAYQFYEEILQLREQFGALREEVTLNYGLESELDERMSEFVEQAKVLSEPLKAAKETWVGLMLNPNDAAVAEVMFDEMNETQKKEFTWLLFGKNKKKKAKSAKLLNFEAEVERAEKDILDKFLGDLGEIKNTAVSKITEIAAKLKSALGMRVDTGLEPVAIIVREPGKYDLSHVESSPSMLAKEQTILDLEKLLANEIDGFLEESSSSSSIEATKKRISDFKGQFSTLKESHSKGKKQIEEEEEKMTQSYYQINQAMFADEEGLDHTNSNALFKSPSVYPNERVMRTGEQQQEAKSLPDDSNNLKETSSSSPSLTKPNDHQSKVDLLNVEDDAEWEERLDQFLETKSSTIAQLSKMIPKQNWDHFKSKVKQLRKETDIQPLSRVQSEFLLQQTAETMFDDDLMPFEPSLRQNLMFHRTRSFLPELFPHLEEAEESKSGKQKPIIRVLSAFDEKADDGSGGGGGEADDNDQENDDDDDTEEISIQFQKLKSDTTAEPEPGIAKKPLSSLTSFSLLRQRSLSSSLLGIPMSPRLSSSILGLANQHRSSSQVEAKLEEFLKKAEEVDQDSEDEGEGEDEDEDEDENQEEEGAEKDGKEEKKEQTGLSSKKGSQLAIWDSIKANVRSISSLEEHSGKGGKGNSKESPEKEAEKAKKEEKDKQEIINAIKPLIATFNGLLSTVNTTSKPKLERQRRGSFMKAGVVKPLDYRQQEVQNEIKNQDQLLKDISALQDKLQGLGLETLSQKDKMAFAITPERAQELSEQLKKDIQEQIKIQERLDQFLATPAGSQNKLAIEEKRFCLNQIQLLELQAKVMEKLI